MSFNLFIPFLRACILMMLICGSALASPWISVGDTRLKQHLHLLNDTGAISISLSSWPIMWADVNAALLQVNDANLSAAQKLAVNELKFEMRYQTKREMKRSLELAGSSSRAIFRDFSGQEFEKGRISHIFDWDGENIAIKLQANLTTDPGDDTVESQLYGSSISGVLGSWVVGVGAIDRWWGPGQQSSLIMSNNARPVPAVFLRTKQAQQFETPWLSWLGRWQFVSFVGQLESSRLIPEAKLTGMRLTFQPFESLEIGLSRAMQWGGEGRSESLSTFWKSVTSQGENSSEQAGNQLAGYDLRFSFIRKSTFGSALYAQLIGEDEAGYLPSKFLAQLGIESSIALESGKALHFFLEHTNTTAGSIGGKQFNTGYSHSVYQSGYRHLGRVIGASYDNDSKVYSAGFAYQFADAVQRVSTTLSKLELNIDGSAGQNTISASAIDLYMIDMAYQRLLYNGQLKLSTTYLTKVPDLLEDDFKKLSLAASWTYRF